MRRPTSSHPPSRAFAESRFRRELDKLLGEDGVAPALKAFENASESSADELSKDELALAATWAKAYESAKTAGLSRTR
jgi:hypothetical protein